MGVGGGPPVWGRWRVVVGGTRQSPCGGRGEGETIVMGLWGDSNFLSLEIIISLSFRVHPGNGTILKSSKKNAYAVSERFCLWYSFRHM